jgi:hypothetical protein
MICTDGLAKNFNRHGHASSLFKTTYRGPNIAPHGYVDERPFGVAIGTCHPFGATRSKPQATPEGVFMSYG